MMLLGVLGLLILVILFFPIHLYLHFTKVGEEGPEISARIWKWQIWHSTPEETALQVESSKESQQEPISHQSAPVDTPAMPSPTIPIPVTVAETQAPESVTLNQPEPEPASTPESAKQDPKRPLYALALHPTIEKETLRLLYNILRRGWKIFRFRIPVLQVQYGLDNPAQLGMAYAGFSGIHSFVRAPEGWEFIPAWDKPGLAALQSEARISITVFRILLFFILTCFSLIRFAWIGWRIYRNYKKDPTMPDLSAWRRWILKKLAPLVQEVQNDQA